MTFKNGNKSAFNVPGPGTYNVREDKEEKLLSSHKKTNNVIFS